MVETEGFFLSMTHDDDFIEGFGNGVNADEDIDNYDGDDDDGDNGDDNDDNARQSSWSKISFSIKRLQRCSNFVRLGCVQCLVILQCHHYDEVETI